VGGVTGILGGAFDPPHEGHVALARAAIDQLGLDQLLVTVVADPGHKAVATPADDRLALARAAFAGMPGVEVELEPYARTVDALEARGLDDPVFLLGGDELADFLAWKDPERVLALARLGAAMRPGTPNERVDAVLEHLPHPDRVIRFELEPLPIASSDLRARLARREPVGGLVPPAVIREIERRGLYRKG
jgi:nicotinate-nucleotide adenylyltransferase